MWRDICLSNRAALLGELERYQEQLGGLHDALSRGDGAALEKIFEVARGARRVWEGKSLT
jgi:prephenate dehydrogenase